MSEKDDLKDPLPLTNDGAFDSAKARTTITQAADGTTTFAIHVTGIDSSAGGEFGAHLHIGPCDNSGGHYQDVIGGPIDAVNEVWIAINPVDGTALGTTTVGFVPDDDKYPSHTPGEMSIVIHQGPLDDPRTKQACFPLPVWSSPDWTDGIA